MNEPIVYPGRCPRCGATLITNGRAVWCTLVSSGSERGCSFWAFLRMEIPTPMPGLREALAAYAHEAWAGWMQYMFSKGMSNDNGTWTMSAWAVERWKRQMHTSYDDLPENEKESDRAEADKMLAIMFPEA